MIQTPHSLNESYDDGAPVHDLAVLRETQTSVFALRRTLSSAPETYVQVIELLAGFHSEKGTPASVLTVSRELKVTQQRAADLIDEARAALRRAILEQPLIDLDVFDIEAAA